jgi:hypothetical protein
MIFRDETSRCQFENNVGFTHLPAKHLPLTGEKTQSSTPFRANAGLQYFPCFSLAGGERPAHGGGVRIKCENLINWDCFA